MKKVILVIMMFCVVISFSTLAYGVTKEVEIEFIQGVKQQGQSYDIKKVDGYYYMRNGINQIRPAITFEVPQKYDGQVVKIDFRADAVMKDDSLKSLYQNSIEIGAETGRMRIECPMQITNASNSDQINLDFSITFKSESEEVELYRLTEPLFLFIEPIITASMYYPDVVVVDLEPYSVGGDITLTGGTLDTINNVNIIESARGEMVRVSSLSTGETVSYEAGMDQSINSDTLLPLDQIYTLSVQYDSPMTVGGRKTLQLENRATTHFTRTHVNKELTLSLRPSVESILQQQDVEVVAEITNNTNQEMGNIQLFGKDGYVLTYEGTIAPNKSITVSFYSMFEPGIMRDFYALHINAITAEAYKGVDEIVIPAQVNKEEPEEKVEKTDKPQDETKLTTPNTQDSTTHDEQELVANNAVVVDEIMPEIEKEVGEIIQNSNSNSFIVLMEIVLGVVIISILAIALTNGYIKRKR